MNKYRATLILNYLVLGLVAIGTGLGAWYRMNDPMWSQMADVRWKYDLYGSIVILLSLIAIVGVRRRREWGRAFSISLSFIALFIYIGLRIFASVMYSIDLAPLFNVESLAMGALSLANIFALTRNDFKKIYSASRTIESKGGRSQSTP